MKKLGAILKIIAIISGVLMFFNMLPVILYHLFR